MLDYMLNNTFQNASLSWLEKYDIIENKWKWKQESWNVSKPEDIYETQGPQVSILTCT